MKEFRILEVSELHPGISRSRVCNLVATVRAESAAQAPAAFAKLKGFQASDVVGWLGNSFKIGSCEYEVAPA